MPTPHSPIPDNVPPGLVVDFDFFHPGGVGHDVQAAWARLHDGPDIVWTPHNGGHWIATRADDIDAMQLDHDHFSHRQFSLPVNGTDATVIPLSLDPPTHTPFRKLIDLAFNPRAMRALQVVIDDTTSALLDAIVPAGHCEFIADFAQILPVNVFLTLVDLPLADRPMLMPWADDFVRSSDPARKVEAYGLVLDYLRGHIRRRRRDPGDDALSRIVTSQIDGRPISEEDALGVSSLLLLGGLDTVASQLGFIANFLARNPDHRRTLAANPRRIPVSVEEFLRRFGISNTARLLTRDYRYKQIQFRQGDMVQMPKCLHGLDDRRHANPHLVDFDRAPSSMKHAAFGGGPHVCPGAVLARREIITFLQQWLARIPDFAIDADADEPCVMVSGMVNSVQHLHLRW
jgi:cytochrome P450